MSDVIQLNIDTYMVDPNTGKPIRLVSNSTAADLGIKMEMEQRIDEFPVSKLGNVITALFDVIPMPSMNLHSIYNEIIIDIRKARQKEESTIQITKDSLEKFKNIFADKPPKDPANNSHVGFVLECVDMALAKAERKVKRKNYLKKEKVLPEIKK